MVYISFFFSSTEIVKSGFMVALKFVSTHLQPWQFCNGYTSRAISDYGDLINHAGVTRGVLAEVIPKFQHSNVIQLSEDVVRGFDSYPCIEPVVFEDFGFGGESGVCELIIYDGVVSQNDLETLPVKLVRSDLMRQKLDGKHSMEKRTALAMALHPRLGAESGFRSLPGELLQGIAGNAIPYRSRQERYFEQEEKKALAYGMCSVPNRVGGVGGVGSEGDTGLGLQSLPLDVQRLIGKNAFPYIHMPFVEAKARNSGNLVKVYTVELNLNEFGDREWRMLQEILLFVAEWYRSPSVTSMLEYVNRRF